MWGKIIIPMYRLWLNGLYGLYGPRCPLFSKRPINLISLSLSEIIYTSHGRMNPLWNQLNKYHHHQIFSWMWQKPMDCFAWMGTVLIFPEQQNSRKGYQNAARIDGLMQERTPVRSQWIYVFFALTHGHGVSVMKEPGTISLTMGLYSKFNRNFILFWYQL